MRHVDIAIVGGGLAGAVAAESYRAAGGEGSVLLLSADRDLPVHRPPLSKGYLRGEESRASLYVHAEDFYRDAGIELGLDTTVVELRRAQRAITTAGGETISYGEAVLATGATPRQAPVPGSRLEGVFSLRSLEQAEALREAASHAHHALIVGAGFIGLEVAASLVQRGLECTVVEMAPRIWPRLVGEETAAYLRRYCEQRGISFIFGHGIAALEGNGQVDSVLLDDGRRLAADLVVVGVGVTLNTSLAARSGLPVDNGVAVDTYLRTGDPHVYAIGDIASFPDPTGGVIHLEHWDNALAQGRALGKTLAGQAEPFAHCAYFFSDIFDLSLSMLGYPTGADETTRRGDPAGDRFTDLYVRDGRLRAALMVNGERDLESWRHLIDSQAPVSGAQLADLRLDPAELLRVPMRAAS